MTIGIEVKAYDLGASAEVTLYFSDEGFVTKPTDTPANTWFDSRLESQPRLARAMFDKAGTYGATKNSPGAIELTNPDGGLDNLLTGYAFDGRPFTVRVGDMSQPYSTWPVVLLGVLDSVTAGDNTVSLVVRDRVASLSNTLTRAKYLGNNVAPDGVEGTKDDLKDQWKPRVYGSVSNVSAKFVNTSKLVYQVSDANCTVSAAYDNGVALTRGADYASLADLLATTPAAGQFRCWQGYFRLGSTPAGQITADAATATVGAAALLELVAKDGGILASEIISAALDVAGTTDAGIWADGDVTPQALLDRLANSLGCWYGFDRLNKFRYGRLDAPVGPAAAVFDWTDLQSLAVKVADTPTWRVVVKYARNHSVQAQPAGSVSQPRKAYLAEEFRQQAFETVSVKTPWPSAQELTFETQLVTQTGATALASTLGALYSVLRLRVDVEISLADLGSLDLGSVVQLNTPRFNLSTRLLKVIGMDAGVANESAKLTLWG
ncbi:hypothetical protein [Cupriavidus necator]